MPTTLGLMVFRDHRALDGARGDRVIGAPAELVDEAPARSA
jgi:hypothetical protein